jgi:hypothetical protein
MNKDEFMSIVPSERIEKSIYIIRGYKVLLDRDLAELYGVETRVLVQSAKRNKERFPEDFMFQLTEDEWKFLRSQIVISDSLRSQFVTLKNPNGGRRYLPYAFTEQGVAMLSGILRSPQAVKVNIEIMRTFVRLRHTLTSLKDVSKELTDLKSFLLKHSNSNDREFRRIWGAIEKLSEPRNYINQRKIGFDLK